jgi:hypothetical protein
MPIPAATTTAHPLRQNEIALPALNMVFLLKKARTDRY